MTRKRLIKLCPAAERHIKDIPPYIGLTGDALRALVEKCVLAQRKYDCRQSAAPQPQGDSK